MAILINQTHPELSIYNPVTGGYAKFVGGKLEIEPDDENYEVAMAEASRNPSIVVLASGVQCAYCGEPFTGKTAKANLASHVKNVHFEQWVASKQAQQDAEMANIIVKDRATFACDICQPTPVFASAEELALHASVMHAKTEDPGATPEEIAEFARRPGEVDPLPV